ncbi:MAG TPA: TonB-dependent receptor plug domain-containing protein [Gemmatimonadaceae bacterium]
MRSSARVLLSSGFLAGLVCGCAHAGAAPGRGGVSMPGTLTADQLEAPESESVEAMLAGRVSGVTVTRTATGFAVRIRGISTIYGRSTPLYILDGMPIEPGPGGSLDGINPHDIARIEVLKDAASTSIYGVRGANGVILITTKRSNQ